MTPPEHLLTVSEVAAYLACAEETVKRLVRRGHLPALRVGPRLRFRPADVERYLARRGRPAPADDLPGVHPLRALAPDLSDPAAGPARLAGQISAALGDACGVVLLADDGRSAQVAAWVHPDPRLAERVRAALAAAPYRLGAGALSAVLQTGQPLLAPAPQPDQLRAMVQPVYWPLLEHLRIASLLVVPLRLRARVLGALLLTRDRPGRPYTPADQQALQDLADRAALALDHARLEQALAAAARAAEAGQRRLAFLAEASRILAASLEAEATLAAITRLLVPHLADCCTVQLLDPGGALTLAAVAHIDEARAERIRAACRCPRPGAWEALVRGGEALLLPEVPAELLDGLGQDADTRALIQALGPRSGILVPLRVRERVLGALQISAAESGRRYSEEDLALVQHLADRMAMALEHARLYQEATRARAAADTAAARATFLAEVSQALAAGLTDGQPLAGLAQKAAGVLADACLVYQLAGPHLLRRSALAHRDRDAERALSEAEGFAVPLDADLPAARVVRSGHTEVSAGAPAWPAASAPHDQALPRRVRPRAYLCAPLVARGRVLGALALLVTDSDRAFGDDEVALAEELARRAALALDNTRLYQAAQEAIAVRDQFLTVAAHELKTPLTALLGNAQLLERRLRQEGGLAPRHERSLQVITEQARRLNQLVAALLDTTRLESGQLQLERRPLALGALVRRVAQALQQTLVRHTITCEPGPDGLLIEGDELRLEQVIQNLLINAVKYSPDGGAIAVELLWRDAEVCLQVRDEGIGIPADDLPNIFRRFYRASNAAAGQLSGIGIGLYVVSEIVSLHGGTTSVASAPGQGSTFRVWLPRGLPPGAPARAEAQPEQPDARAPLQEQPC